MPRLSCRPLRHALKVALVSALLASVALASPRAYAGEEDDAAVAKKLKEQVEKILRLMRENEDALLKASSGGKATPKKPEIDLPTPPEGSKPPEGQPPPPEGEGTAGGTAGGEPGEKGSDIVRELKQLVEAQKQGARKIPLELEELIRMIPERSGGGGGAKKHKPGEAPKPEDQEARDARKRLEEMERQRLEQEERERQAGKDPQNPRDPKDPARKDPNEEPGAAGSRNVPAWLTGLPPEIRDAFANGDFGSVPPAYRDLVRRYVQWLSRQTRESR